MIEASPSAPRPQSARALREVGLYFLRLGFTAFGGPAAHIAMMQAEVVDRRGWLRREEFLDLLGAANLIPGPSSTELAIFIGYRRAGFLGLLLAGLCFILPAASITFVFAWAYVRFGALPQVAAVLFGIKPVIIAVVVQALWTLGRTALKSGALAGLAVLAAAASFFGMNALAVLLFSGILALAPRRLAGKSAVPGAFAPGLAGLPHATFAIAGTAAATSLTGLFLVFFKVGAVLYGSGYVLLAFLRADLVDRLHWLTESQLLDAIAIGQFTPGPVFTTATFIGYVVQGPAGALLATLGIFLPSFLLVAASGPLVRRLRQSPAAGAFLDGVNVAALALMATVTWQFGRSAIVDFPTAAAAVVSAILLVRLRVNSFWLILAGALLGIGKWWLA